MKKYRVILTILCLFGFLEMSYADNFVGQWKLFMAASGEEIKQNEPTIGLVIVKAGAFYNVKVEMPQVKAVDKNKKGWEAFNEVQQRNSIMFRLGMIESQLSGKYTLSDDEKAIENLKGGESLKYKKNGEMLCASIGCFHKGEANSAGHAAGSGNAVDGASESRVPEDVTSSALGDSRREGDAVIDLRTSKDSSGSDMYVIFAARAKNISKGDPGHAFVGWGGSDNSSKQCRYSAWGFYPRVADAKAVLGYVPAGIKNDAFSISPKQVVGRLIVRTDSSDFGWIEEAIEKWSTKKYNLLGQNCINFMMDVATGIGLRVPTKQKITLPENYVKALIAANRSQLEETPQSPAYSIVGNWHGTVKESDYPPYPVEMKFGSSEKGTVNYNMGKCLGDLSGAPTGRHSFKYNEVIASGPCINGAVLNVQLTDTDAMSWSATVIMGGKKYTATATLKRD